MPYFIGIAIAWLLKKFSLGAIKSGVYLAISIVSWGLYLAVIAFGISWGVYFGNLITNTLSKFTTLANGSEGGCAGQTISYMLNCSGVADGFTNTVPILLTAISFFMLVQLNNWLLFIRSKLDETTKNVLSLI